MTNRSIIDNNLFTNIYPPAATGTAAFDCDVWVSMVDYDRCAFIVSAEGTITNDVVFYVREATDDSGSDAQSVSGYVGTLTAASGDGDVGILEIENEALTASYDYVSVRVAPEGDETIAIIACRAVATYNPVPTTGYEFVIDKRDV